MRCLELEQERRADKSRINGDVSRSLRRLTRLRKEYWSKMSDNHSLPKDKNSEFLSPLKFRYGFDFKEHIIGVVVLTPRIAYIGID